MGTGIVGRHKLLHRLLLWGVSSWARSYNGHMISSVDPAALPYTRAVALPALLAQRVVIIDGAMGTMIYQRGVFLNACYDELCLTQAQLILGIHQEYVDAGAEVLETNSFGANRYHRLYDGL